MQTKKEPWGSENRFNFIQFDLFVFNKLRPNYEHIYMRTFAVMYVAKR